MISYQNYKNLCFSLYKKSLKRLAPQAAQSRADQKTEVGLLCQCAKFPGETAGGTQGAEMLRLQEPESPVPWEMESFSSRSPWCFSVSGGGAEELVLLGIHAGSTAGCQAWQVGPAQTGDVLQPGSELIPQLRGLVHAEERGQPPLEVPFPLHKGSEGGDTVANEVVSLAKDVQVDLGHFRLQAHHLHLQEEGKNVFTRVVTSSAKACSHTLSSLPSCESDRHRRWGRQD